MRVVGSLRQAACRMCCLALCLQGLPGLNARPTDAPTAESWALLPPAHFEVVHNHEVVSTVPAHREPRGIVFALHGCLQLVTEWGFQSEHCPDCHGMPEEMLTVWKLWRRGYATVAVGPLDGGGGYHCYATGTDYEEFDIPEVPEMVHALRQILTDRKWWHLPRYAMGTSRGGSMALILALHFPLQGVGSMVMGLKPLELLDESLVPTDSQTGATWAYPPVLLMQAANDQPDVINVINRTIPVFSSHGIHIRKFIMQSYPITATFFAERMRGVSVEVSERLQRRWREVGLLDEHGFSNTMDGEALGRAREVFFEELEPLGIPDFEEFEDQQGERGLYRVFIELLWAAGAVHEITGQHVDTMLDFFEDTTHHDPHRWEKGWEGRGAAHAHTLPELVISGEELKPREPEAGTAATARRLWPMGRQ